MNRLQDEERLLAESIRAAAPRTGTPPGLDTRIMAAVALRSRRRRERRAVFSAALCCLGISAAVAVVGCVAVRSLDVVRQPLSLLPLLATLGSVIVVAAGDRIAEILRRL